MEKVLMTRKEAAEFLGVTTRTLVNWEDEGLIKAYKAGRGVRYDKSDVFGLLKPMNKPHGRKTSDLVGEVWAIEAVNAYDGDTEPRTVEAYNHYQTAADRVASLMFEAAENGRADALYYRLKLVQAGELTEGH